MAWSPGSKWVEIGNAGGGGGGGGVTAVTGTPPIYSSGGTTPDISFVGPLSAGAIAPLQALTSVTNDLGTQEIGTVTSTLYTISWTYNRGPDPFSQTFVGIGALPVAQRSQGFVSPLSATTTFTVDAVGNDVDYGAPVGNPSSGSTTIQFLPKHYFGVDGAVLTTGADIMSSFGAAGTFTTGRAFTHTFDASAGTPPNYLYVAYPATFGSPAATFFNGFAFSDYTETTVSLTNAAGYTQNYIILRTNNQYSGASILWQIT